MRRNYLRIISRKGKCNASPSKWGKHYYLGNESVFAFLRPVLCKGLRILNQLTPLQIKVLCFRRHAFEKISTNCLQSTANFESDSMSSVAECLWRRNITSICTLHNPPQLRCKTQHLEFILHFKQVFNESPNGLCECYFGATHDGYTRGSHRTSSANVLASTKRTGMA